MESLKLKIAGIISDNYCFYENPTYEQLLEVIYDNYYRTIGKVGVNIFLMGIVEHFMLSGVDHANKILSVLKQVVVEALESNGVELTYTDSDWLDLKIIENPERLGGKYILSHKNKAYMSEFFEF